MLIFLARRKDPGIFTIKLYCFL